MTKLCYSRYYGKFFICNEDDIGVFLDMNTEGTEPREINYQNRLFVPKSDLNDDTIIVICEDLYKLLEESLKDEIGL